VHDPDIVFMDDPTSNLDEDAAERVYELLGRLKERRRTVIIVANSSEIAFRFADRLGVIKGGSMAAFGAYEETVGRAEAALSASLARLRARGTRAGRGEAGAENSQRGDV
jgi:ABC-2 type transport system ATP-binding protein